MLGPRIVRHVTGHQIDHLFGDIGHMIAHAFDVLGDEMQVHTSGDVAWIFHHVGQEFAEQRVVQSGPLPRRAGCTCSASSASR